MLVKLKKKNLNLVLKNFLYLFFYIYLNTLNFNNYFLIVKKIKSLLHLNYGMFNNKQKPARIFFKTNLKLNYYRDIKKQTLCLTKKYNLNLYKKIFKYYLPLLLIKKNNFFYTNKNLNLCFLLDNGKKKFISYNLIKFYLKLKILYNFCLNIFFYNMSIIFFGNKFFKKTIHILNLKFNKFVKNLYISYYLSFINRPFRPNPANSRILPIIKQKIASIVFVFDVKFHLITLFFLQKNSFFILGLVPLTGHTTNVHYRIFISENNYITFFFFYRYLLFIKKHANLLKFFEIKKL